MTKLLSRVEPEREERPHYLISLTDISVRKCPKVHGARDRLAFTVLIQRQLKMDSHIASSFSKGLS